MNLSELIKSRRTIHDYNRTPVDWQVVQEALELSLWSLNHKLTFPWVYIRVGAEARSRIAEVMVKEKEKKKGTLSEPLRNSIRAKILNPAEVIFLGQKRSGDAQQAHEDYATLAASVQIASLYLWSKDIGSKWSTGGFISQDETLGILGVNPDEVGIVGCFYIGHAERVPKAAARPSLKEVLFEVP
jgi:nitroreductase